MKLLRTIDLDALSPEKRDALKLRQAARAVVFDHEGSVALLYVQKGGYYKIPGGGVEQGEDFVSALQRECLEEIGCNVEVGEELGMTIEFREKFDVKQESYCYMARLVGSKGEPNFTEKELADGFSVLWIPLQEAIKRISETNTEDYQGKFIVPRELVFLREAENICASR